MRGSRRRGFVLLSVLWFLAGVASLALATMLLARGALLTAGNRIALTRAEWRAEECLARVRAAMIADRRGSGAAAPQSQSILGRRDAVLASSLVAECPGEVALEPLGVALDVNGAPASLVSRVLQLQGISIAVADSLTDALLDWRDADDTTREFGAERAWYASRGEPTPRNGPLADAAELRLIRGFAAWMGRDDGSSGIEAVLTVGPDRILIEGAPSALVAALPGITPEIAAALELRRRNQSAPLPELLALVGIVPERARDGIRSAFGELGDVATVRSEGWLLRARSSGDPLDARAPRLAVTIELRLVPDGTRLAVSRRRIWP